LLPLVKQALAGCDELPARKNKDMNHAGFQGFHLEGVSILQPTKKPRGGERCYADKARNRLIPGIRVRIEHTLGSVKRYRIIKDQPRNWKPGFRDLVFEICCALHNFRLNFRPWHYQPITYLNCLLKPS
jgi:hypothetical protein